MQTTCIRDVSGFIPPDWFPGFGTYLSKYGEVFVSSLDLYPESQLALLWSFRPIAEVLDNPCLKFALSVLSMGYQGLTPWEY